MDILEEMPILDTDEKTDTVLIRLENDIFDTVALVVHMDESNEEVYFLRDMQGQFPTTIEEASGYDWITADEWY